MAQEKSVSGVGIGFIRDVQALALGREHGFWDHRAARKILNERYGLGLEDLPDDWTPPPAPPVNLDEIGDIDV